MSLMMSLSSISMIIPLSSELRAKRSGCHARIASYFPLVMLSSICVNLGLLPEFFADFCSVITSTTLSPSDLAKRLQSSIWLGIDLSCAPSSSDDLRAYRTYLNFEKSGSSFFFEA